jgi:hypothetical protein
LFMTGFLAMGAVAVIPALSHDTLHTIYERTIAYQSERNSPFSVWGLYGWHGGERAAEIAAVGLALGLPLIPRRGDLVGLAAGCGAILIGVELTLEHWFYLYIPWFFPLVMLALLGRYAPALRSSPGVAAAVARSSPPEAVLSS